jgi:hypothetical protein
MKTIPLPGKQVTRAGSSKYSPRVYLESASVHTLYLLQRTESKKAS